ncbi:hypothetical protein [Citrobacter farmeri]
MQSRWPSQLVASVGVILRVRAAKSPLGTVLSFLTVYSGRQHRL